MKKVLSAVLALAMVSVSYTHLFDDYNYTVIL